LSAVNSISVVFPASILSLIPYSDILNPCVTSSVVTDNLTIFPFLTVIVLGLNSNFFATIENSTCIPPSDNSSSVSMLTGSGITSGVIFSLISGIVSASLLT